MIVAGFLIACTLIVTFLVLTAPEGFEDERGWHAGRDTDRPVPRAGE